MNSKTIGIAAIALSLASAGVLAQTTLKPGALQLMPKDIASQSERIAALEKQVAQLTAQVSALSSKLDQTSKSAFDASFKAGTANIWISANGDGAVAATNWVNANGSQIMSVVTAFPKHTHTYQYPNLGYTNVPCDPGQGGYCSYISKWTSYDNTTSAPK